MSRVLRDFDDPDLLWDFDVQEFQTFLHLFPPKYSYLELQIERHASLVIDGYDLLRDFDVREFRALQLFFL
jgi:hypothetical protein